MNTTEILKVFEQAKPVQAISEYEKEQQAMRTNFERLQLLRNNRLNTFIHEPPERKIT
jgi:hypothetical protein